MNQTPPETLYDILGLDYRTCEFADIKKAYRTLARKHHPDRVKPENKEESTKIFRRLTDAYEILSDGPKKLRYDSAMGLYRKRRNSRIEDEAGNYYNKNTVARKGKRPSGNIEVEVEIEKKGNFLKNALGKMKKPKRPSGVAPNDIAEKYKQHYGISSDTKEPINDKNNETTTPAKKKCPILPTFQRKEGNKSTCKIKVAKCCECLSDCRMLCSFEDLDSITIFAMVSVIGGTIFFIAVLVVLTVVHVI